MKNYLVVGASTGIGQSLAKLLSEEGHQVFGTYKQNEITDDQIQYSYLDVLDEEINLDFLPDQLDGLVYCPGAVDLKAFHRISIQGFRDDFELQVIGAIKMIQAALPKLKQSENASIVLFSTVAVKKAFGFHTKVAVSKGAIEGLTKSLSADLAPKIRVNCISPSLVNTPLVSKLLSSDEKIKQNAQRHPLQRIGKPKDIASMAAYLLSENASWITGQNFHVDGGMS